MDTKRVASSVDNWIFAGLLFVIVFQYLTIQKLVNKVMSKDFHEYKTAETYEHKKVALKPEGVPEDLRSLTEFNMG